MSLTKMHNVVSPKLVSGHLLSEPGYLLTFVHLESFPTEMEALDYISENIKEDHDMVVLVSYRKEVKDEF